MTSDKDQLYAAPRDDAGRFRFDEQVARVFPDMINRSVPGYGLLLEMIAVITSAKARAGTCLYDLGCSLGAATLAMRHALHADLAASADIRIIAVDNSAPMIERCRSILEQDRHPVPVSLVCADIESISFLPCSVVTMNFTLQFIALERRAALLGKIAQGLCRGGALILSEKLRFADDAEERMLQDLHHDFKRARGYSRLEIARKRAALEQVLVPETFAAHRERLLAAGFSQVTRWFQCFNFCSIVAIR